VNHIWVSYKPDHGHEGAMHNDTAYGLLGNGKVGVHKVVDGLRQYVEDNLKVIEFASTKAVSRHGVLDNGQPRPYKGYKGDSNYCIEIVRNGKGKWEGEVVSTFAAYQLVRSQKSAADGIARLRHPLLSVSGKPLVMRLMIGDYVRAIFKDEMRTLTVKKIKSNGGIFVARHNEANVRQREDAKDSSLVYGSFTAGSLQKTRGRYVTVSPIGEVSDPGFKE
jgi:CRISPR-associated endonuclease Csn1